jgi:hypothetical protein
MTSFVMPRVSFGLIWRRTAFVCLVACSAIRGATAQASCGGKGACATPTVAIDTLLTAGTLKGLVVGWVPGDTSGTKELGRLSMALVTIKRTGQKARTTIHGEFTFAGLRPGPDTLTIRYIGFFPTKLPVFVPERGGLRLLVVLQARPIIVLPVNLRTHSR